MKKKILVSVIYIIIGAITICFSFAGMVDEFWSGMGSSLFIIGVIQDSVETALNSSSDLLLSASAEFRQWRKEGKEIKF